jgi:hypothetical protein
VGKTLLLKRRERLRDYEWSSYRDYAGLLSGNNARAIAIWFARYQAGAGAGTTTSQKLHCGCDASGPVAEATSSSASIRKTTLGNRDTSMSNVKTRPLLRNSHYCAPGPINARSGIKGPTGICS